MNKRGISGVVVIVLIVLLALVAITVIWLFVSVISSNPSGTFVDDDFEEGEEEEESVGFVWTENLGNPQPDVSVCPSWNCLGFADPTIGRLGDDLLVWGTIAGDHPFGPLIGRAISSDGGATFSFSPESSVVEPPLNISDPNAKWDRIKETVSIQWNSDVSRWDMWYLGYNVSFEDDPAFGFMQSSDEEGVNWPDSGTLIYRPASGSWDAGFLTGPTSPVRGDDGVWRIYYVGAGTDEGVGMLISDNKISWERYVNNNPVFVGESGGWDEKIIDCSVQYINGQFMMWYTGYSGVFDLETTSFFIGVATSDDGVDWERHDGNPVIVSGGAGEWNDLRVLDGEVVVEPDGSLLMAAYGNSLEGANRTEGNPYFKFGMVGFWRSSE